jgi:Fe-S-cluster containining protein
MEINLDKHRQLAAHRLQENRVFLERLKKKKPKDLDDRFHELHEEAFDRIDCLSCANCCKTTSPIFYQKDIERVAKRLRMKPQEFIDQYLHIDADNDYVLNSAPCPFLDHENYCMVYEDRPTACREYPHTNRKRMFQIMELTKNNTVVCPAVLDIVEQLKLVYK